MGTEARNPRSIGLDKMTPQEIVRLMNEEEHQVIRAMKAAEPQLAEAIAQCAEVYNGGGRIVYVGAGTSGRVARMDAAEMPPTFGIDNTRFIALTAGGDEAASNAIEDAEDEVHSAMEGINKLGLGPGDALIALAASGRTPYVVAAAKHAGAKGVWTCGIANNPGAPLFDHVDLAILLETGPEVLTGSTRLKAGTSQKLALNTISTGTMVLAGKVVENLMIDVKAKNHKPKWTPYAYWKPTIGTCGAWWRCFTPKSASEPSRRSIARPILGDLARQGDARPGLPSRGSVR